MAVVRRITLLTNPDVCNLHCPLCFLNQRKMTFAKISGIAGEMNFDVARAAIEKYSAVVDECGKRVLREVIPSTMGEPLLYSHFEELLTLCETYKIPLNLTTNGTFPGKWGLDAGMERLLASCIDIKVSSLSSECLGCWKQNVERLLAVRKCMSNSQCATVTIQVTLHKKNLMMIPELIAWASVAGIERIKWNSAVFLSGTPSALREEFELDRPLEELQKYILDCCEMCGSKIRNEGSLFTFPNGKSNFSLKNGTCPFADELWILPDGSEQHCPSPERRFGNENAECCFI